MSNINLLSTTSYVSTPFIKVTIGNYTFGIYDAENVSSGFDINGVYKLNKIRYPNYIQSLTVDTINGIVNKYSLNIAYMVTEENDPNFFEKVFSSVSKSRTIIFSYGDLSVPSFIYKNEEAQIIDVKSSFNIQSSTINYTVSAISKANNLNAGKYTFRENYAKPSDVIKHLLYESPEYGLLDLFPGMRDRKLVEDLNILKADDIAVNLDMKANISILDYLNYLVENMTSTITNSIQKDILYIMLIKDDTSGVLNGTYFEIVKCDRRVTNSEAYNLDIGYPSQNIVIDFRIENNENYSILYNYQKQLNDSSFVRRINHRGEIEEVYAPILSSGNNEFLTNEEDKSWWSKMTEYPIKAAISLKGLLRPAILMGYLRLNVYFFGKKHVSSGLYIVTRQQNTIDSSGFRTDLNLMRIDSPENDLYY